MNVSVDLQEEYGIHADEVQRRVKEGLCQKCGEQKAVPQHICAFAVEWSGDQERQCNCCLDCQKSCEALAQSAKVLFSKEGKENE